MTHSALSQALQLRQQQGLYRRRRLISSAQGPEVVVDGVTLLSFCSNDYLGLANDPRLVAATQRGAERYGVGTAASHLITGHNSAHHVLEQELAEFVGSERALLFSTGYMANIGVVTGLCDRHSLICEDKLNHASLIDAARMSRARVKRFGHKDSTALATHLAASNSKNKMVTTDGVFSMDGDQADLPELTALCKQHQAWLLVDDAHGLGVLGPEGRGSLAQHGLIPKQQCLLMGTLGKAFGSFGAFVAASAEVIETLIQRARTYIYTTALPGAVAEATRQSLQIVKTEPWRRQRLQELVDTFRRRASDLGLPLMASTTPIQPLLCGPTDRALQISQALESEGILVSAIRPPTVAQNSARLRITFSARHTDEQLQRLLQALANVFA